jgi:hypothetical protein
MEESKGFKVEDKRHFLKEERPEKNKPEKSQTVSEAVPPPQEKSRTTSETALPPVFFSTFIASLSSSALVNMGEIPDPTTGKYQKNLMLAKQTIEILEMLKEKTRGNLDNEEDGLLNNILFDLRVRYVKLVRK